MFYYPERWSPEITSYPYEGEYNIDELVTIQSVDFNVRYGDLDTPPSPPDSPAFQEPFLRHWGPPLDYNTLDFVAAKSAELVSPDDSPLERARKLFLFVKTEIQYMPDPIDTGTTSGTDFERKKLEIILRDKKGNCVAQSFLLVALCRTNPEPIPARVVCGELISSDKISVHHWAEFYLEGIGWIPVDPTLTSSEPLDWFGHTDTRHFSTRYISQLPIGAEHLTMNLQPDYFKMWVVP